MAKVHVAYEDHACREGCGCEPPQAVDDYVDRVHDALGTLGSADPEGEIASGARYIRGAEKAGLAPKQAAAMLFAMTHRDPTGYQPRFRYEDVAEPARESAAHDYEAVDNRAAILGFVGAGKALL